MCESCPMISIVGLKLRMSLLELHSLVETVRLGVLTLESLDLDMVVGVQRLRFKHDASQ